ncbi:MAG: hypothetical protein QXM12_00585 [Nitrososphaerota archaeon]
MELADLHMAIDLYIQDDASDSGLQTQTRREQVRSHEAHGEDPEDGLIVDLGIAMVMSENEDMGSVLEREIGYVSLEVIAEGIRDVLGSVLQTDTESIQFQIRLIRSQVYQIFSVLSEIAPGISESGFEVILVVVPEDEISLDPRTARIGLKDMAELSAITPDLEIDFLPSINFHPVGYVSGMDESPNAHGDSPVIELMERPELFLSGTSVSI